MIYRVEQKNILRKIHYLNFMKKFNKSLFHSVIYHPLKFLLYLIISILSSKIYLISIIITEITNFQILLYNYL